jgi:hypothetical protein
LATKFPVLLIRDVYPGSWIPDPNFFHPVSQILDQNFFHPGSLILDLNFFHPGSWIPDAHPSILTKKNGFSALRNMIEFYIPDPDPESGS